MGKSVLKDATLEIRDRVAVIAFTRDDPRDALAGTVLRNVPGSIPVRDRCGIYTACPFAGIS